MNALPVLFEQSSLNDSHHSEPTTNNNSVDQSPATPQQQQQPQHRDPSKRHSMGASVITTKDFTAEYQAELCQPRPTTPRRSTDPLTPSLLNPSGSSRRTRNRSPLSRGTPTSQATSGSLSAPPMTRAHSLPTVMNTSIHPTLSPTMGLGLGRPASPVRSPARTRSPFRLAEESFVHSGAPSVPDIDEDAELELTPRALSQNREFNSSPLMSLSPSHTFPRRRRPASPLHHVSGQTSGLFGTPVTSANSSPLLSATKFNEAFPSSYSASLSSSVPSTPTSTRSRSPSISSLETIPDSPDAEAEAIEADRLAALESEKEGGRRGSLDAPAARPVGFGFKTNNPRKRWSVCGAESRRDLDLETIWED